MFELLPASQDPGQAAGVPVAELLEHLRRYRVNANISACARDRRGRWRGHGREFGVRRDRFRPGVFGDGGADDV